MIKNYLLSVILLLMLPMLSFGQYNMFLNNPTPAGLTRHHLLSPTIINAKDEQAMVYLHSMIYNEAGEIIAEMKTSYFTLALGVSNINYEDIGLASEMIFRDEVSRFLENYGTFPIQKIIYCTYLYKFEQSVPLAKVCGEYIPTVIQQLRLFYPKDSTVIKTPYPVLTWLPAIIPSVAAQNIDYTLRITEILPYQSAQTAITSNPPLFENENIPQTAYPYSGVAQPLKEDQWYAWQVDATIGGHILGQSEVWVFTFKKDSFVEEIIIDTSATVLDHGLSRAFTYSRGVIRFKLEGKYNSEDIIYSIIDQKGKDVTPTEQKLVQSYGVGIYGIQLDHDSRYKHKQFYTLIVKNEKGPDYYLQFQYLNPRK